MKYVTVKLTEDQAKAVVRVLDFGKSEPLEQWDENKQQSILYRSPEEKQYDAFLTRIQQKIWKQLFNTEYEG